MFRTIGQHVFSFDLEWIPDPRSGHILHGVEAEQGDMPGAESAMLALWKAGGATPAKPTPFLRTFWSRIVSVAGVLRVAPSVAGAEPELRLVLLPENPHDPAQTPERAILGRFLKAVDRRRPQLVGYNSANADLPILVQRSIVHGLPGLGLAKRPDKPWEGYDYFSQNSEAHLDLALLLGRPGTFPSLHEAATLCGIPGKIDVRGDSVPDLWLQGRLPDILAYNACDAFTTHLLWARIAHFAGLLDDTAYRTEQRLVRQLLEKEIDRFAEVGLPNRYLRIFLEKWTKLYATVNDGADLTEL